MPKEWPNKIVSTYLSWAILGDDLRYLVYDNNVLGVVKKK